MARLREKLREAGELGTRVKPIYKGSEGETIAVIAAGLVIQSSALQPRVGDSIKRRSHGTRAPTEPHWRGRQLGPRTAVLARQVLGAIAQFEKASSVAKLGAVRGKEAAP